MGCLSQLGPWEAGFRRVSLSLITSKGVRAIVRSRSIGDPPKYVISHISKTEETKQVSWRREKKGALGTVGTWLSLT